VTTYRCLACGHLVTLPAGQRPTQVHSAPWRPGDGDWDQTMHNGPWQEVDGAQGGLFGD
jgi:hypothetical protein